MKVKLCCIPVMILALSGCERVTVDVSQEYALPTELSECTVHEMRAKLSQNLYVVRCPETTTTNWRVSSGKNSHDESATINNYQSESSAGSSISDLEARVAELSAKIDQLARTR